MTEGPQHTPEQIEAMKRMFRENKVAIPRPPLLPSPHSSLGHAIAQTTIRREKVALAMELLEVIHGPTEDGRRARAAKEAEERWRRAEKDIRHRLAPKDAEGNVAFPLRALTEDGEILWVSSNPEAALYQSYIMGEFISEPVETPDDMLDALSYAAEHWAKKPKRAKGRYRCLECGNEEDDPIFATFGPPSCSLDGGAMVKVED